MIRIEFIRRKLHLIAEDLGRLVQFRHATLEEIASDFMKMATVERLLERVVMRAIDINEHLIAELAKGREDKSTRLTYRDTFLKLAELGICPNEFAEHISKSAGLRNILIHDYESADQKIILQSINSFLVDYPRYIDFVSDFITRRMSDL